MKGRRENMHQYVGKTFSRLTVVSCEIINGVKHLNCVCECGNLKTATLNNVKHEFTRSCGCIFKEQLIQANKNNATHNKTKTTGYRCWAGIKSRCLNPKVKQFILYGGRGIKICDEWVNSFEKFLEDMGQKPTSKHSLDRIDVNGHYKKSNCRWATSITQGNNRNNNVRHLYFGESLTIAEAARKYSLSRELLRHRLKFSKLTPNEAVLKPLGPYVRKAA